MLKQITWFTVVLVLTILIGYLGLTVHTTCRNLYKASNQVTEITTHLRTISEKLHQLIDADRGLLDFMKLK